MKTKAALAIKAGEDLIIEELDLDGPGDNEVLVEIKYSGSFEYVLSKRQPMVILN